jgi:hypothetical protein
MRLQPPREFVFYLPPPRSQDRQEQHLPPSKPEGRQLIAQRDSAGSGAGTIRARRAAPATQLSFVKDHNFTRAADLLRNQNTNAWGLPPSKPEGRQLIAQRDSAGLDAGTIRARRAAPATRLSFVRDHNFLVPQTLLRNQNTNARGSPYASPKGAS